jgi:hypothetical protein
VFPHENLNTWDEFEQKVRELEEETRRLKDNPRAIWATTEVLYRGEGNADWLLPLSSTLERTHGRMTAGQYFDYIIRDGSAFSNISDSRLEMLKQQISKLNVESIYLFPTLDADTEEIISVMAELRHNGFPSPLVDWTSNPLVAAFFAFENEHNESNRIAIFALRGKTGYTSCCKKATDPTAIEIGPSIKNSTSRHRMQKSQYTLCVKQGYGVHFKDAEFANIQEDINIPGFILLENGEAVEMPNTKNVLRKYTLPVSERIFVLKMLKDKGIDRKSLVV